MTNESELLRKILYNSYIRSKFLDYEENKELFYKNDKEELVKKLIEQIKIEISNMNENTFDIKLILSWYDDLLKDYYINSDSYLLFHDPLTKLIQDKLLLYNMDVMDYITYITEMQLYAINNGQHTKCLCNYLEYKNQTYLTNDEFERYVYALNELDNYEETDYYYIFNMILDKLYTLTDDTYKNFYSRFGLFVLKEFELETTELGIKELPKNIYGDRTITKVNGKEKQTIEINNLYLKSSNATLNLNTLFHEIKHVLQVGEMNSLYRIDVIKNIEDILLIGYIYRGKQFQGKNLDKQYYAENYQNISGETDANICSRLYLLKFLEMYAPLTYKLEKNRIEIELQKYTMLENDNNRLTAFSSINDLQILFTDELQKHPEIMYDNILTIEQKIVLLQIYEPNCKPKTPDKYFDEKAKILDQMTKIPLKEEKAFNNLKKKLDFYDGILSTFKYNRENLVRNLLSLRDYKSTNDEITAEAMQYAEKIKQELELYEQITKLGDINGRNKK